MDKITVDIDKTMEDIDREKNKLKNTDLEERASQMTGEALERIEISLENLNDRIRTGAYDVSSTTLERARNIREELVDLRNRVKEKRKNIEENGIQERTEEIMEDVRNRYNRIVDKYLKA